MAASRLTVSIEIESASSRDKASISASRSAGAARIFFKQASAIVALIFNELKREEIVSRAAGYDPPRPKPHCIRSGERLLEENSRRFRRAEALIEALSLLDALSISLETVKLDGAIVLAERMKLSLYDASYLWLAHARATSLSRLTDRLARADEDMRRSK